VLEIVQFQSSYNVQITKRKKVGKKGKKEGKMERKKGK
jgi:hypothetical protein